jgi:hypothetical protein
MWEADASQATEISALSTRWASNVARANISFTSEKQHSFHQTIPTFFRFPHVQLTAETSCKIDQTQESLQLFLRARPPELMHRLHMQGQRRYALAAHLMSQELYALLQKQ